jgi:Ser/Thr protein kinase RdoA (MazF antagonist)
MDKITSCETILADEAAAPSLAPADRFFLQNVYERLRGDLEGAGSMGQPIHGDSHVGNAIITDGGAVWMDLESVCIGPIEWDIGFLPPATWSEFEHANPTLIRALADARSLCVATWCWAEFDRSPATNEAALHHLGELKHRFG